MREFKIDAAGLAVLGSCFYYAYVGMQIPAGLLLDRYGARKLLSFAVLVSALGVILFARTHSFYLAGFARMMVGFGSAFSFVSALYLIANWFSHRYFALMSGLVQFGACVGSIVGLAPLAILVNNYGWRETLDVVGVVTLFVALLYWFVIRDGHKPHVHHSKRPGQLHTLKKVVRTPQVWWIALTGFCCWAPVAAFGALWGVSYLMKVYHFTNETAGWWVAPLWLGVGLGSPLIGLLSDQMGSRKIPFYLCFGAGVLGGAIVVSASYLSIAWTASGLFLIGLAGALQSLTFGVAKDVIPSEMFATASGFINMVAVLGGAFIQIVFGFLLHAVGHVDYVNGAAQYNAFGYQISMVLLPAASLIGFLITRFFLIETHCRQVHS